MNTITRETAWGLLTKYNKEPFHQHHAVTVEGVMRYYAEKIGEDSDFWGICGLLHDVDFEQWPENTAPKPRKLLAGNPGAGKWSTPSAATVTASAATSGRSVKWRNFFLPPTNSPD